MAFHYAHVSALAEEMRSKRVQRDLSFDELGTLAGMDRSQAFRICTGRFKTLNPGVLRICSALGIHPRANGHAIQQIDDGNFAAMLSAEVLAAWDRTEAGAMRLRRILRALRG